MKSHNEALLPVLGLNDDAQDELILRLPGLLRARGGPSRS